MNWYSLQLPSQLQLETVPTAWTRRRVCISRLGLLIRQQSCLLREWKPRTHRGGSLGTVFDCLFWIISTSPVYATTTTTLYTPTSTGNTRFSFPPTVSGLIGVLEDCHQFVKYRTLGATVIPDTTTRQAKDVDDNDIQVTYHCAPLSRTALQRSIRTPPAWLSQMLSLLSRTTLQRFSRLRSSTASLRLAHCSGLLYVLVYPTTTHLYMQLRGLTIVRALFTLLDCRTSLIAVPSRHLNVPTSHQSLAHPSFMQVTFNDFLRFRSFLHSWYKQQLQ